MSQTDFQLFAAHEWVAHDPFGRPKPGDRGPDRDPASLLWDRVSLPAPRGGYVSFRLLVRGRGAYRLAVRLGGGLQVDLFKCWYHRLPGPEGEPPAFWPDALLPLAGESAFHLPDPENGIDGQVVQAFWVDVYVPADAPPGPAEGAVHLKAGGGSLALPVTLHVAPARVPDRPCIVMDHNSYGARWLWDAYPRALAAEDPQARWRAAIELLQHYYRLAREHRGLFHNLGYGHSGAFDPIYGPAVVGRGRDLSLIGWELYDRHYGPLLDGSAFHCAAPGMPPPRQAPRPLWGVYTPINPNWPASVLWWGERGYEVEFTRGVAQFDAHLRDKGWTDTRIEFFFNHKKRYRWFGWDGDEVKHAKDLRVHRQMVLMWEGAVAGSPVPWVYRQDASWQMARQFDEMAGYPNFWVCGGFHRWYPEQVREVVRRGDVVWWYGGAPSISAPTAAILRSAYETWARGLGGYCNWLATDPGPDPWFDCNGAATGLFYPGERFGIAGPLSSIRLKVQRNGVQDLDLLDGDPIDGDSTTRDALRAEVAREASIPLWSQPPPAAQRLPPDEWTSRNLRQEHEPVSPQDVALPLGWWQPLRTRALEDPS